MKYDEALGFAKSVSIGHRIGAHSVPGADQLDLVDPARAERFLATPSADKTVVDDATAQARAALSGAWRRCSPADRGRLLHAIGERLKQNEDMLAALETLCMGKPLMQARKDVRTAARFFEYYAGIADKIEGETIPLGPGMLSFTELEPVGVNAQIVPWNAPLAMMARGLAPALAAGCTVVAKPAETTPLSALVLADICTKAGLPDGVLNIVLGDGRAGAALAAHPEVNHVTFTGSVPTGKKVMVAAAEHLASVTLELGGKSPLVVLADANLDAAAQGVARGIFGNAGQICAAASRLIVDKQVAGPLIDKVDHLSRQMSLGHGLDDPNLGPLASEEQFTRVRDAVGRIIKEGDTLLSGGGPADVPGLSGYFFEPTILRTTAKSIEARQEIFGPVLAVIEVTNADEATEVANDSDYGLVAGIYTANIDRAHAFARAANVGQVFINGYLAGGVETPVGGRKNSGFGREKGLRGLQAYLSSKCTTISLG